LNYAAIQNANLPIVFKETKKTTDKVPQKTSQTLKKPKTKHKLLSAMTILLTCSPPSKLIT